MCELIDILFLMIGSGYDSMHLNRKKVIAAKYILEELIQEHLGSFREECLI